MFLKIIKKTAKLSLVVLLIILLLRPDKVENFIDCDASDGSISVAGNEIPVGGSVILDVYSEVEKQASALIPSEISKLLESVSDWIKKTFSDTE